MQIHNLTQGSPEWLAYRARHFNASDAPAMMGCSPYKTRNELLHESHAGLTKEVDAFTQSLFDAGHRFEALARKSAKAIVGGDLYPVTGSLGRLSASFDGLTMMDDIVWEHKTLNDDIRAAATATDLGLHLRAQMEQQLYISGAGKALFTATRWDDAGNLVEEKHFWYESDLELREKIIAGWQQFEADLHVYVPCEVTAKPIATPNITLPALVIQTRGEVLNTNLPLFRQQAEQFLSSIKTVLETDEDFVNADLAIKDCDKAERAIEQAKGASLAQMATVDEVMRIATNVQELIRAKRLMLEKLVDSEKLRIKTEVLATARQSFADHIAGLEKEIAPLRLQLMTPDFAGAIKGKRTLTSLKNAADTTLANAKIAANTMAAEYRAKQAWCRANAGEYAFLYMDMAAIIAKPMDDFQLLVNTRVDAHKRTEEAKAEALRARIAEEERVKAEVTAAASELAVAQAKPDGAYLSPAAQALNEQVGTQRFVSAHRPLAMPVAGAAPSLSLGKISERLGFALPAEFLRSIGFEPAGRHKSAILFHEAQFPQICAALVAHIESVQIAQSA